MAETIVNLKLELRRKVREEMRALTEAKRATGAQQARKRLEQQKAWKDAKAILFYAPLPGELDIWPLLPDALAAGKDVFLPRFDSVSKCYQAHCIKNPESDLNSGPFGIREPGAHCPQSPLN